MEIDEFIEQDILIFLDDALDKIRAAPAVDAHPSPSLFIVRDYEKELFAALDKDDILAAKRVLHSLKKEFDECPSGTPDKQQLKILLITLYDKFKEHIDAQQTFSKIEQRLDKKRAAEQRPVAAPQQPAAEQQVRPPTPPSPTTPAPASPAPQAALGAQPAGQEAGPKKQASGAAVEDVIKNTAKDAVKADEAAEVKDDAKEQVIEPILPVPPMPPAQAIPATPEARDNSQFDSILPPAAPAAPASTMPAAPTPITAAPAAATLAAAAAAMPALPAIATSSASIATPSAPQPAPEDSARISAIHELLERAKRSTEHDDIEDAVQAYKQAKSRAAECGGKLPDELLLQYKQSYMQIKYRLFKLQNQPANGGKATSRDTREHKEQDPGEGQRRTGPKPGQSAQIRVAPELPRLQPEPRPGQQSRPQDHEPAQQAITPNTLDKHILLQLEQEKHKLDAMLRRNDIEGSMRQYRKMRLLCQQINNRQQAKAAEAKLMRIHALIDSIRQHAAHNEQMLMAVP